MTLETRLQRIERRLTERDKPRAVLVYTDPVHFARHSLGFQPDPWQEQVLSWTGTRLLLNCSRQSGKSTISAILALHRAVYFAKSLILLVSPTLRQSSELFKKVGDFLQLLPIRPALVEDNKLSLQLANGSRIVSLPGSETTIRGFSGASLIIEDEASRVDDAIFYALRPMLATSNGRHVLMSTPWGRRGHFFEAWDSGEGTQTEGAGWEKVQIMAEQCPRISPAFLAEERRIMPQIWFDSEYHCLFTDVDGAVFRYADLLLSLSSDIEPLHFGGES